MSTVVRYGKSTVILLMALVATSICAGAQDSTYLRLDGANSGLRKAAGQVRYPGGYPGANFGAKVSAAIAALGGGGTVDATGLGGVQSMSATINIPDGVTVLLGSGLQLTSSVCPVFELNRDSHLQGAGAWVNAGIGTYITTNSSNCNAITTGLFSTVEKLTIDNTALTNTNSNGIYCNAGGFNNVRFVRINNFSKGVYVNRDYYDVFEGVQAAICNYGAYFDNTDSDVWILGEVVCSNPEMVAGFHVGGWGITLINPDVENVSGNVGTAYDVTGSSDTIINPYFENVATGIMLEAGALKNTILAGTGQAALSSFTAAEGADPTNNAIHITNGGGADSLEYPDSNLSTANFVDFDTSTGTRLMRFQHDNEPITSLSLVWGPDIGSPSAPLPYTAGSLAPLNVSRLYAPQMLSAFRINPDISGVVNMDLSQGEMQEFTLNGDVTSFSFTKNYAAERATVEIYQLAPGGHAWYWSSNIKGGMAVNRGLGMTSAQSFQFDGTNWIALGPGFSY